VIKKRSEEKFTLVSFPKLAERNNRGKKRTIPPGILAVPKKKKKKKEKGNLLTTG